MHERFFEKFRNQPLNGLSRGRRLIFLMELALRLSITGLHRVGATYIRLSESSSKDKFLFSLFVKAALLITGALLYAQTALAQPAQRSVYALYGPVKTQRFVAAEYIVKQGRVLEALADLLSALLRLPSPIVLTFQECGQSNAFFNPQARAIILCYEFREEIDQRASRDLAGSPELARQIKAGAFVFVLFHELSHALIHTLNLSITGREEDVADQIATYLALKARDDTAIEILQGGVWFFSKRYLFSTYTSQHFADEHSLNEQRQFNITCWAYGKDSRLFTPLAQSLGLPGERARRCRSEYARMAQAIELLLRDSWNNAEINTNSPGPSPPGTYEIIRSTSVFEQPSESSRKVSVIMRGTRVMVVGSTGDWLEVRSKRGNPSGFIRRDDAVFIATAN